MSDYTQVFGGETLYPSQLSYLALALTADTELQWPLENATGSNLVAGIIDVTPTGAYAITMPPANQTTSGQQIIFRNLGASTITVKDNGGSTIVSIAAGLSYFVYLASNSTAAGTWRNTQLGASTAQAQASDLAGYGLTATGPTLSQEQDVTTFNADYTAGDADRAKAYVWTDGIGTLTLTAAATLGNGWFMSIRNEGSGNLTVDCSGADNINGAGSITLRPADSCAINCDGTSFYTVGLGQDPVFAFDFTVIDLTGVGATYTLSGAELNRIAYQFIGVLANDVRVNVPATTQQYWVANDTTGGSYTVSVATAAQASPVTVNRGSRGIYYSQGTDVVHAETASVATPIAISDGGTGATTASGARINLGGTATGIAVFTAASTAAAQTAIGSSATGSSLFTAANAAAALAVVTPLTTKGDLFTYAAASTRLAVGTDGQVLTADSAQATGLKWATAAAGSVTSVAVSGGTTGLTTSGGPITGAGTITFAGTLVVANGGTGATTLTGILKGNGTSAFTAATAGTDYVAPATATNFTAKQTFTGSASTLAAKFVNALEKVTISATAATGTINYDITTQSNLYYTSNAAANWTINFRGDGSNSLDSLMATGESVTVSHWVTQGGTAYYNSTVQVDGTTVGVTTKWLGAAPSAGVVSTINVYSYVVTKTGSATFTVLASQASFA